MNQTKRLILYLFINVIVSACTILTILWLWDRPDQPLQGLLNGERVIETTVPVSSSSNLPQSIEQEQPTQNPKPAEYPTGLIEFGNIIGAGSVTNEVVIIKRLGDGELQLAEWKLQDANGNIYTFPDLTLYKDGAVYIHTTAGLNTVIDLYWNNTEPVWQVGETATLIDPLGNIQATYQIP